MNVTGVVLAAGLGTRLRPATDVCPKPLIPVAGVEPLFFALLSLHRMGVRRAVVNAHHKHEHVKRALQTWAPLLPGMELRLSVEWPEILGTGGGVKKIVRENEDWFKSSGLLLQNGDTMAHLPLGELIDDGAGGCFAVSYNQHHLQRYKPLWVSSRGTWSGIGPQAPDPTARAAHFLGIHYLSPSSVGLLLADKTPLVAEDLFNGIYRPLSDAGHSFVSKPFLEKPDGKHFWFDMNTPEYLLEAQKHLLDSLIHSAQWSAVLSARYRGISEVVPGVWAGPQVSRDSFSFRAPAVVVSDAAELGSGAARIALGPHASLVCSHGVSSSCVAGKDLANSVLVITRAESAPSLPRSLHNSLCVV
ncbi:MAG: NTP transferase domain-containing protein [Bdellovibrionales bacterium]|nr:NTP transferase domain-containing protein [Bdellovibrionales bacterium]